MTEVERPPKATGRRVANAMEKVLWHGARGKRLAGLKDGPTPEHPAVQVNPQCSEQEALVKRHLGFDADSAEALGGWIEPDHEDATGGKSDYVRFPKFWREWMTQQDRDSLGILTEFGRLTPEQVVALKALIRREIESEVKRAIWSRARKIALLAAGGAFAFAHWGADQITWIKEKGPLLKELGSWLLGLRT